MKTEIEQILDWFKAAVPNPTDENLCVQIGCHYEEIGEIVGISTKNVSVRLFRIKEKLKKTSETTKE